MVDQSISADDGLPGASPQRPLLTAAVLLAHTYCPRKAYLLLAGSDPGSPHRYPEILRQDQETNRSTYMSQSSPAAVPYQSVDSLRAGHSLLTNAILATDGLQASCDILHRVACPSLLGSYSYEPLLVIGTHTVTSNHELELLFAGYVLGKIQGVLPPAGQLVALSGRVTERKLEPHYTRLQRLLTPLRTWITTWPATPPPVILNNHCPICPFRGACRAHAEQTDDLSLLDRMTPRLIQRYQKRGIFTVTQLSYLFKPRRSKKAPLRAVLLYRPELQALALRMQKTLILMLPQVVRNATELFFDIEGIPDQHFYYLFGLLICADGQCSYQGFWADTQADEGAAWQRFLAAVAMHPNVPIYHYGSYESHAVAQLNRRYDADDSAVVGRLINILPQISGRLYFPVYSNGLKDLGRWIGAIWSDPTASGLQSLVWRHDWEAIQEPALQDRIVRYNEEDCWALWRVVERLSAIAESADAQPDTEFAYAPKRQNTPIGAQIHQSFAAILRVAAEDYEQKKITLRQIAATDPTQPKQRGAPKGHVGYYRPVPKARKIVQVPGYTMCPQCPDTPLQPTKKSMDQTIIDLCFTANGCRKTIVQYVGPKGICPQCGTSYSPPAFSAWKNSQLFGRGLQAWVVYQRITLRLPYRIITQVMEEQFGESITEGSVVKFIRDFADYYQASEKHLLSCLLAAPFIHVDETRLNIQGTDRYVWVFTDGFHVMLRLTDTRETTLVGELLAGYKGVLVSDFYPGYDALPCRQQKCWVHLIRDLNDDLWANPLDREFEGFVLAVKNLIGAILEPVQAGELRRPRRAAFERQIEEFYTQIITGQVYTSEVTLTYQQRFVRYRTSLFVFLEQDGLPWNNNMAERAFRCLAVQRNISKTFYQSLAPAYLRLLSIGQTCRFQDKSLLQFFLSGETDLDQFRSRKRAKAIRTAVRREAADTD